MSTARCRTAIVLVQETNYTEIIQHQDPQEARKGEDYLHAGKGGEEGDLLSPFYIIWIFARCIYLIFCESSAGYLHVGRPQGTDFFSTLLFNIQSLQWTRRVVGAARLSLDRAAEGVTLHREGRTPATSQTLEATPKDFALGDLHEMARTQRKALRQRACDAPTVPLCFSVCPLTPAKGHHTSEEKLS